MNLRLLGVFATKVRGGLNVYCHFGDTEKADRKSEYLKSSNYKPVSPSKKRQQRVPHSAVKCLFCLPFAFILNGAKDNKVTRWRRPVKLAVDRVTLSHTCKPSVEQQTLARRRSGFHTKRVPEHELERILVLMENGCKDTTVYCAMMEKLGFRGGIHAIDIHNLKAKAQLLRVSGNSLSIDQAKAWLGPPGLADQFPETLLNGDAAVARAKQMLLETLQSTDERWKTELLLEKLKASDPHFAYKIMYDDNGHPIGVVWTTKILREAFRCFGHLT